ncbi:hypothetical protein N0V90_002568 [Kalmusia sp. IMI 367209]|nr:hypothetical protein N0V90_002568 [Kalmusia sp. IMI 367209]
MNLEFDRPITPAPAPVLPVGPSRYPSGRPPPQPTPPSQDDSVDLSLSSSSGGSAPLLPLDTAFVLESSNLKAITKALTKYPKDESEGSEEESGVGGEIKAVKHDHSRIGETSAGRGERGTRKSINPRASVSKGRSLMVVAEEEESNLLVADKRTGAANERATARENAKKRSQWLVALERTVEHEHHLKMLDGEIAKTMKQVAELKSAMDSILEQHKESEGGSV